MKLGIRVSSRGQTRMKTFTAVESSADLDSVFFLHEGQADDPVWVEISAVLAPGCVVVRGTEDFARVATGDVIVIPFSDVSWTPLFARAAGVVAEATGGILSHAAIVAREYGIPCVVGVTGACDAIPDGVPVVVDGTAGTVLVKAGGSS